MIIRNPHSRSKKGVSVPRYTVSERTVVFRGSGVRTTLSGILASHLDLTRTVSKSKSKNSLFIVNMVKTDNISAQRY
jgi:hypothetical protein